MTQQFDYWNDPGKIGPFYGSLEWFIHNWQQMIDDHYGKNFPNAVESKPMLEYSCGKKYIKITDRKKSVYAFIDPQDGGIYKPDGWTRPAKHVRGNIGDTPCTKAVGPYGVNY